MIFRHGGLLGVSLPTSGGAGPRTSYRFAILGEGQHAAERKDIVIPLIEPSIPALLEERAQNEPYEVAYTFIDYEVNPDRVCREFDVVAGPSAGAGRCRGAFAMLQGW